MRLFIITLIVTNKHDWKLLIEVMSFTFICDE